MCIIHKIGFASLEMWQDIPHWKKYSILHTCSEYRPKQVLQITSTDLEMVEIRVPEIVNVAQHHNITISAGSY